VCGAGVNSLSISKLSRSEVAQSLTQRVATLAAIYSSQPYENGIWQPLIRRFGARRGSSSDESRVNEEMLRPSLAVARLKHRFILDVGNGGSL